MRRIALLLALSACPSKEKAPPKQQEPVPPPVAIDAAVASWTELCEEALVLKQTPARKLMAIIAGCEPCGDWRPLLEWETAKDAEVQDAMEKCNAYCSKDAKMAFNNFFPDARGKSNKPWRQLGEKCKEAVSAVPDVRFMSAPYFVLDRIARETAKDPKLAPLAAALELPLPPLSMTGIGYELPEAAVMKPEPGKFHITVTANEIRIGTLPTAKLTANGVVVDHGATPYPGELVAPKDLRAKLDALVGSPTGSVVVIAPVALPATRILDVAKAAGKHELSLAAKASGGPPGWTLPGYVPVTLDAAPDAKRTEWKLDANVDATIGDLKSKPQTAFDHPRITIGKTATVAHLAKLLGAIAFRDGKSASLAK